MTWNDAIAAVESGDFVPYTRPQCAATGAGALDSGTERCSRCSRCTRLARLDESGRCYACRPRPPVCDCGGEARHEAGCPVSTTPKVVCAWCSAVVSPGREPASHGLCGPCATSYFYALDQSGPQREVELDAEAERVARCVRASVTP